ncbi:cadherin-like beta sandwich domain-containing protein [Cohnella herbarum]|uniref:SLH domain-containing protein n=1 Tax=Cohnella herbarum TaxID=2728023 RepID=A0A7Z2VMH9_9BACL|nr:cadherin-like beta sandwich domain-containing protein [Cohnella herbarum]QJD85675.1 hypothetical protein HH215_22470 [Cohnella herbarum]
MRKWRRFMASILAFMLVTTSLSLLFRGQAYAANGDIIVTVAGTGSYGSSGDGGLATDAEIKDPRGIVFDSNGNLYIADSGGNRVRKVDKSTGIITTVAGTGAQGFSGDGGQAEDAQLAYPSGIAFDAAGNLYISDTGNNRVRRVDADDGIITTVAGTGNKGYLGDNGPATFADLNGPTALAFDRAGNLYIADTGNNRVRKVSTSGTIITVAGTGTGQPSEGAYSGDGGPASANQLNFPYGLAVDSVDNLYISDSNNHRIRMVAASTGNISTVTGVGYPGYSPDRTDAEHAYISIPIGLAMDSNDNLYIADAGNSRIRILNKASNTVSTIAGNGSFAYSGDGIVATASPMNLPAAVALHSSGTLYIADSSNNRIRRLAPSNNSNLSGLTLSSGSLSPGFVSGTTSYTASVSLSVYSVTVTPTVSDVDATVTVDSAPVTSGTASGAINLSVGANLIPIEVTAHDGTAKTYTVTVTRASDDASLSGLALSSGTLSPTFAWGTTGYSASVANNVNSITVTPTVSDSNATVTVDGVGVASGAASGAISLNVGANAIPVVVTAQDGTTISTYTVTVTRAPSNDASLSGLALSSGTLSPTFAWGTTGYAASVANAVGSITVTPTVSDSNATVTVDGVEVASGAASGAISLNVGANAIPVVVTAQNGTTISTYTVTVTRAPSNDASLSGLALSSGTLSPTFASGTTGYAASVANAVGSITMMPTVSHSNATVTVDGVGVASGAASGAISLIVGANAIPVVVTAQDGTTTSTYTVTVTRAPAATSGGGISVSRSNDARLSGLTLSSGSLSPAFASGTTSYSVSVANSVSSLTVAPSVTDRVATVKVNGAAVSSGSASGAISLKTGDNSILVTVTAEDGTTKSYMLTVTRASDNIASPVSRGPLLNEKIANAPKVRESSLTALQANEYKPFADVKESRWSFEAIQVAQRLGIVQGKPDGNFHGADSITRAEFTAMVANALYLDTASGASTALSDTKGHWAEPSIGALTAAGVIEGMGDGTFKPNQQISRAEISAILARLMIFDESIGNASFADTTGNWARQWIELLAGADVVKGQGDNKFNPSAYATREQAVALILRMLAVCRNVDLQWID